MSFRLKLYSLTFICMFLILLGRLFFWQVYKAKELSIAAKQQHIAGYTLDAKRGEILTADSGWLAASAEGWLVYATPPKIVEDPKKIAEKLAPLFLQEAEDKKELLIEIDRISTLLKRQDAVWVPIKHKIARELKEGIEKLEIEGIGFEFEERRVYPEASNAAQLIGFVGKDEEGNDKGYFGLEGYYDLTLTGKPGFLSREQDAKGIPIPFGASREISAIGGVDLLTHIDPAVQFNLEKKLSEGMQKYGASGGTAIVMDPKTGAILGMSSYPTYDPNTYWEFGDSLFTNPAISSSFEPGSIFKVVVMASAIDAGAVEPDTTCECSGPARVDRYSIETWNQVYHPNSTMTDVIANSDNVGMVFVGERLGKDKLYDYLRDFGIGEASGIDLQGEAAPNLRDKDKWSYVDLATASFGQGIAVTPIQIIRAAAAIANKGNLPTPHVVDRIIGEDWEENMDKLPVEKVISEKSAAQVTAMMVEAAKRGESKWTYVQGFKVAGKTGTAQIPISGHYDSEKTIASFVGFAPYDNPKFIMLVILQEPQSSPWASETAAPLWYSIAKDLFMHYGIQPEN